MWLQMANQGSLATSAAHFSAYANAYRSGGPWQYTVAPYSNGADGTAKDFFNIGANYGNGQYDLTVMGPNRFLRRFVGNATSTGATAEASTYYAPAPNTGRPAVWFKMTNTGSTAVTFTITSTNYRTDGTWTYQVAAGATVTDYFNAVAYNNGWYDFTVTVSVDAGWSRRATGHIETGAASVTG